MAEYLANEVQSVQLNTPILFNSAVTSRCSKIYHEDGTGVFILKGAANNPVAPFNEFQVTFNGNIAIPTGGTVGPIAVAIAVTGEPRVTSRAIYTPAAVDEYGNVTSTAIIKVPRCCCFTISVEYVSGVDDPTVTPAPAINVQNANLVITPKF